MSLPKLEIKLTTPTEASIEVAGRAIGKVTISLKEQETITGVDNAIVVLGDCENLQNNSHHGFVFHYELNGITAATSIVSQPKGA